VPKNDSVREIRRHVGELVDQGKTEQARDHWLTAPIWQGPKGGIDPLVCEVVSDYFSGTHRWD